MTDELSKLLDAYRAAVANTTRIIDDDDEDYMTDAVRTEDAAREAIVKFVEAKHGLV